MLVLGRANNAFAVGAGRQGLKSGSVHKQIREVIDSCALKKLN